METLTPLEPTSDERSWGLLTHLSALLGFFIPFGSVLGPLIFWSIKKHESNFVDENGKASLNFHLTWTIVLAILWIIWLSQFLGRLIHIIMQAEHHEVIPEELPIRMVVGAVVWIIPIGIIYLFRFVLMLIGTIQASNGNVFNYPLTFRFVK